MNARMPKVTVVIPAYNHAAYLPDALNSVLAQTFADWEIVLVDDGSTDATAAVAACFTDSRIRYIFQENRGLSGARNTGIAAAQGELIALLDADDTWEPEFLATMCAALNSDPSAGAAYCGFRYMDGNGQPLPASVCRVVPPEQFRDELFKGSWLSACTVVVRRAIYQQAGPFDERLRACEDYDMWLRISQQHRFVGLPRVLAWYRRVGNNMSDDVDRLSKARRTVLEKHLGSLDTPVESWASAKRLAVSSIYTSRSQECLAQGRITDSADALIWLLRHQPSTALSLDLWYALACVHQGVGQRGDFDTWQPVQGEADAFVVLDQLARHGVPTAQLRKIRGQVYFALALLNYGQNRLDTARSHLRRSLRIAPSLSDGASRLRLAIKLMPGGLCLQSLYRRIIRFQVSATGAIPT